MSKRTTYICDNCGLENIRMQAVSVGGYDQYFCTKWCLARIFGKLAKEQDKELRQMFWSEKTLREIDEAKKRCRT